VVNLYTTRVAINLEKKPGIENHICVRPGVLLAAWGWCAETLLTVCV